MSTMRLRRTEERTDVAWAPAAQLPPPCAMLMQALWYRTLNWASVMASGPTRAITGDGFDTGGLVELHAASDEQRTLPRSPPRPFDGTSSGQCIGGCGGPGSAGAPAADPRPERWGDHDDHGRRADQQRADTDRVEERRRAASVRMRPCRVVAAPRRSSRRYRGACRAAPGRCRSAGASSSTCSMATNAKLMPTSAGSVTPSTVPCATANRLAA